MYIYIWLGLLPREMVQKLTSSMFDMERGLAAPRKWTHTYIYIYIYRFVLFRGKTRCKHTGWETLSARARHATLNTAPHLPSLALTVLVKVWSCICFAYCMACAQGLSPDPKQNRLLERASAWTTQFTIVLTQWAICTALNGRSPRIRFDGPLYDMRNSFCFALSATH